MTIHLEPWEATPQRIMGSETKSAASAHGEAEPPGERWLSALVDSGWLPDGLLRWGIRRNCAARLREAAAGGEAEQQERRLRLIREITAGPIAIRTEAANAQHYEVPAEFFRRVLGRRMKYSCGYWPPGVNTLDASEEAMLALTAERARIEAGQEILELGCGWGSLTLYLAERWPESRVTAVSNSRSQKEFIDGVAASRGLRNVQVITADMNQFEIAARFDRVVSVEMFEHMRNYPRLLGRIACWMRPGALLFVHIFSHRRFAYPYEARGAGDWMARYFFTGGMMPSDALLPGFQEDLHCREQWRLDGTHYQRTARAWLERMDADAPGVLRVLGGVYGPAEAHRWRERWRIFFMACEEMWGYRGGSEWGVCHYVFEEKSRRGTAGPRA